MIPRAREKGSSSQRLDGKLEYLPGEMWMEIRGHPISKGIKDNWLNSSEERFWLGTKLVIAKPKNDQVYMNRSQKIFYHLHIWLLLLLIFYFCIKIILSVPCYYPDFFLLCTLLFQFTMSAVNTMHLQSI